MSTISRPPQPVHISATQVLPQLLPNLKFGDVLQLIVRSNTKEGRGLLYYKGQLIPATLPADLQQGDRLLARLESGPESLLLRLLEVHRADGITSSASTQEGSLSKGNNPLLRDINVLLERFAQTSTKEAQSIALPQLPTDESSGSTSSEAAAIRALVLHLKEQLQHGEELIQATKFENSLPLLQGQASIPALLKESAAELRQILANLSASSSLTPASELSRIIVDLQALTLAAPSGESDYQKSLIEGLLSRIQAEQRTQRVQGNQELGQVLAELLERLGAQYSNPNPSSSYNDLLQRLETLAKPLLPQTTSLDAKAIGELQHFALRLEQLASAHESLQLLNPLLRALGEPALLLFPYLFQGWLFHAELQLEPPKVSREEKEGSARKPTWEETYSKIQVQLPLPNLGLVNVEIAYSTEDILIRFNVGSSDVREFLLTQCAELEQILGALSVKVTQISASVGLPEKGILESRLSSDGTGGYFA